MGYPSIDNLYKSQTILMFRECYALEKVHVGFIKPDITHTPRVIAAMIADVRREAFGEIVESRDGTTAIGKRTASLFKEWIKAQMVAP